MSKSIAERIEALGPRGDNSLDVLVEIARFIPNNVYTGIRANDAGTTVIYTDQAGNEVTCWAQDWTTARNRQATLEALRTQEATNG